MPAGGDRQTAWVVIVMIVVGWNTFGTFGGEISVRVGATDCDTIKPQMRPSAAPFRVVRRQPPAESNRISDPVRVIASAHLSLADR